MNRYEDTITLPIGLDCSCPDPITELRVMPIDTRHEKGCSHRYPDSEMYKDCDCHE